MRYDVIEELKKILKIPLNISVKKLINKKTNCFTLYVIFKITRFFM